MKESSLYGHVVELLGLTEGSRKPADAVVAEFFRARRYLGARDRRCIADTVFDVIRHRALLDHVLQTAAASDPGSIPEGSGRLFALLIAVRIAVGGVPHDAVEASIGSLWQSYVHAVTFDRCCSAVGEAWRNLPWPPTPAEALALRFSIHRNVVSEWVRRFGAAETERLCAASNALPPVTARVNTLLCTREECQDTLRSEGIETEPTLMSPVGLVFPKRSPITSLQVFRRGWIEMQDEGSQLLSSLVNPAPGNTILDACAGAGGKTLHLAALMKNSGVLVAADAIARRLEILKERSRRAGITILRAGASAEGRNLPAAEYDAVLIDAPCSGTGTYRRNPWLKGSYSDGDVDRILTTQQRLLDRHAQAVKPGGRLVYATCSLLERENENQIEAFLHDHHDFALLRAEEVLREEGLAIDGIGQYFSVFPHRHGTDGYFGAVLEKRIAN